MDYYEIEDGLGRKLPYFRLEATIVNPTTDVKKITMPSDGSARQKVPFTLGGISGEAVIHPMSSQQDYANLTLEFDITVLADVGLAEVAKLFGARVEE